MAADQKPDGPTTEDLANMQSMMEGFNEALRARMLAGTKPTHEDAISASVNLLIHHAKHVRMPLIAILEYVAQVAQMNEGTMCQCQTVQLAPGGTA